jgi:hypothetical protein
MFKRSRWLVTGVAVGAGASLWAERKARALAARYSPADRARGLPGDVVAAWQEGRQAMREREAELKARSNGSGGPNRSERRKTRA